MLAESVLIVFSVLLALGVDEWREDRELQQEVREARAAFAGEIRGNRDLLRDNRYLPHHRAMWTHYRAMAEAADAGNEARLAELEAERNRRFNTGIWPTPLRDSVWRSLSQSDLPRHMKQRELFLLADAYQEQEALNAWHDRMFDAWSIATADKENPNYKRSEINITRSYFADVVAAEERLLEHYDKVLELLERDEK